MNITGLAIGAAICLGLASGCTGVTRATPEEMRSAPGATSRLVSTTAYDRAYSTTLEQVKACFERAMGMASTSAFGDKSAKEATVSLGLSSALSHRILATITLTPMAGGTDIALYAANDIWHSKVKLGLTEWLIRGTRHCPDDVNPI